MAEWIERAAEAIPLRGGTVMLVGVLLAVAGLLAIWALGRRTVRRTLVASLTGAGLGVGGWIIVDHLWQPTPGGLGWFVWLWIGLFTAGVLLLISPLRLGGWGRRVGVVVLAALVTLGGSIAINSSFGAYPNVASVFGWNLDAVPMSRARGLEPVEQLARPAAPMDRHWKAASKIPQGGVVVSADIPATQFQPRTSYIYLPPAYFASNRPALPVLVLLAGQPGSPAEWFTMGGARTALDAYAAAHGGLAPIVVSVDHLGSDWTNPLCSDYSKAKVATYLGRDVPAWVTSHLQVDRRPESWAIAGLSNGGTCAMQIVTRRDGPYRVFLNISGERHPNLGGLERTIARGFGGDRAAFEANDPLTLMKTERYPGVAGVVSVGIDDTADEREGLRAVLKAARAAGMSVEWREYPGAHQWAEWEAALADQVPWLGRQFGLG